MSRARSLLEDVEAFLHHQQTARHLSPHTLRAYTGDLVELVSTLEADGPFPAHDVDVVALRRHLASLAHGNIARTICSAERRVIPAWPATEETPPRCPNCRQWLRPDVVWFGEELPGAELSAAREAAVTCDVFLAIGTSAVVYPAAGLIDEALEAGATVVEINPHPTPQTPRVAFALAGPAGEWLPALVRATFG